ncbi:MAG: hypothetical protein LPK02_07210 [Rhodobacterales bacterium]|nr:hypothetical protein [Rhodobacterales bacterium]
MKLSLYLIEMTDTDGYEQSLIVNASSVETALDFFKDYYELEGSFLPTKRRKGSDDWHVKVYGLDYDPSRSGPLMWNWDGDRPLWDGCIGTANTVWTGSYREDDE